MLAAVLRYPVTPMPQAQFPFFPVGVTHITPHLAFVREQGRVTYFTADLPVFKTFLVPTYEKTGPYGAKSVSEICINGALPAIGNAICDAVGVRLVKPPYTAEKVLRAIKDLKSKPTATGSKGKKAPARKKK